MRLVKLGIASVNTTVGAMVANVDRALVMAQQMADADVTVAVFNEQLVGGYPQEDLIQWQAFAERQWVELERYARRTAALPMVSCIGLSIAREGLRYNCAAVVAQGEILGLVPKEKLPTYNVFYEGRTYARGGPGLSGTHHGVPFGDLIFGFDFGTLAVEVCEDLWSAEGPIRRRVYSGAELVCNLSASPYRLGVEATRRELISTRSGDHQCTVAYVNQVGAQDGLIFDGGGYVIQNGRMLAELPRFRAGWTSAVVDLDRTLRLRTENTTWRDDHAAWSRTSPRVPVVSAPRFTSRRSTLTYPVPPGNSFFLPRDQTVPPVREQYCEELLDALALGVGDYFEKTGAFERIGIALSGGRDSLLTLLIAHRYAQRAQVPIECFSMPTRYSSAGTQEAARTIADELGVRFTVVPIEDAFTREVEAARSMLGPGQTLTPLTLQNIQARIRAQRMWNWANSSRGLFLQTGNMSEKAVGYTTIGGDLMGALAVISNVPKTVVMYVLEHLHHKHGYRGIELVMARPAGPELAENQVGEDELMPFPVLDACFYLFAGEKLSPDEVVQAVQAMFPHLEAATVQGYVSRFVRLFTTSIFKWVQSPVSLHVGNLDLDRERALQLPVVTRLEWTGPPGK